MQQQDGWQVQLLGTDAEVAVATVAAQAGPAVARSVLTSLVIA